MEKNASKLLLFALCFSILLALTACVDKEIEVPTDTTDESETEFVTPELNVEEKADGATVSTSLGLSYTVSGYTDVNEGAFDFTSGLIFNFSSDVFSEQFNRFTMHYSSSVPVHIYVKYTDHRGQLTVADFFLERGNGEFSGLILDYLSKKTATSITEISVDSCTNEQGSFSLLHLDTEKIESYVGRYGSTEYYIENQRFKLGIDMSWGGAICYIADLNCSIPNLQNLVNKADEGRLIQQSYYGTPTIPGVYEPGEFNNAQWNYNPVQGGDKYGNDSRIIDVAVTDTSIYIKAQPQDWSLDGAITPSYMENTYILHDDYIEVKNRFVDFSGWTHPVTTQEIPAFYTVSYLDTFVWYDGASPWSNDTLSYRNDLNFWGDPQYRNDSTFTLKHSNTETWCAWINESNDYGLGIFVPNADVLLAGRLSYDGTMDADGGPCGYVAPLKRLKLVSYEALEYSYLLTAGSVEDIRATFTQNKGFTSNEGLNKNSVPMRLPDDDLDLTKLDFSKKEYCSVFSAYNSVVTEFDSNEAALKATVTDPDPYAAINFKNLQSAYIAGDYTTVEIVYMIPSSNALDSYSMEIFLSTGDVITAQAGKSVIKSLVKDGTYHTLTVDLSTLSFWNGAINEIRVDFFTASAVNDAIYIKSIELK